MILKQKIMMLVTLLGLGGGLVTTGYFQQKKLDEVNQKHRFLISVAEYALQEKQKRVENAKGAYTVFEVRWQINQVIAGKLDSLNLSLPSTSDNHPLTSFQKELDNIFRLYKSQSIVAKEIYEADGLIADLDSVEIEGLQSKTLLLAQHLSDDYELLLVDSISPLEYRQLSGGTRDSFSHYLRQTNTLISNYNK